jgi:FKBP12-rapamycin complex-associated protein
MSICTHTPPHPAPAPQTYLLDLLSLVLTSRPFSPTTPRARVAGLVGALAASELQGAPRVRLALNTLGSFDFGKVSLLEFVRDHILPFIDDGDKEVRQSAALACCRVLERHAAAAADVRRRDAAAASGGVNGFTHYGGWRAVVWNEREGG